MNNILLSDSIYTVRLITLMYKLKVGGFEYPVGSIVFDRDTSLAYVYNGFTWMVVK